jgi:AcrR family transcriptional regulator
MVQREYGKVRDRERTQSLLVESAMRMFAERGYDGVSVDHISNDAGVNKRLVFYYFVDKRTLFSAAAGTAYEKVSRELSFPTSLNVKKVIMTSVEFFRRDPVVGRLLDMDNSLNGLTARAIATPLYGALQRSIAANPVAGKCIDVDTLYQATIQMTRLDWLFSDASSRSESLKAAADFLLEAAA